MKITIDFTDKDVALLGKALMLENRARLNLVSALRSYSLESEAELFSREFTLEKYIYTTLIAAVEDEVERNEEKIKRQEAR